MSYFDVIGNLAALFNQSSPTSQYGSTTTPFPTFGTSSPFALGANAGAAGGAAGPAPAPAPPGGQSPFPGYLTPQQQLALAQRQGLGALQPILAEIHYQQQVAQAQAAAQVAAARGQAQAVAQKLAGIAPQVQAGYKQAADSQAGYAKGYSDQTQQTLDQSAAQSNDLLHTVAPNTKQTVGAPAIGDLLFGTQGKLPADTLQTQGAAFTAAANLLPGTALGRGQQAETLAQSQGAANAAQLAHQAGTYAGQLPKLTQDALAGIQTQQRGLYNAAATSDYRKTQILIGQLGQMNTATGTVHVLGDDGKVVDTGRPTPTRLGDARQTARDLSGETGTVVRVDAKGNVYQPLQNGKPIPTQTAKTAAATDDYRTQQLGRSAARDATAGTGIFYQYNPKTGSVDPTLDKTGKPQYTPQGRAANANVFAVMQAIADNMSRQDGKQRTVDPSTGAISLVTTKAKDGTVVALPTRDAYQSDRTYELDLKKYNLSLDSAARAQISQLQSSSPFVWTYDKTSGSYEIAKGTDGKPLLNNAGRSAARADQSLTDSETAAAWTHAQADAVAKTQSGIIFHTVEGPGGKPVVEPWVVNGKPQFTTAFLSAQKKKTGGQLSARDRIHQNSAAEKGARLAFQGGVVDEKAPHFKIASADPGNGTGWSEAIEGADGKLIGYHNHYPPTDFATAFQDAVENGVDPKIATAHLLKWFNGHPDRGGPMTSAQRAQVKVLRGKLKKAGIKPEQYVPNSDLPKLEQG